MDPKYTKKGEFVFDDNGLQNVCLLASTQETVFSECISDNARDDSKLSHSDAIPKAGDEAEAPKIAFDERNPSWTVPFEDDRGTNPFEERPRADGVIKHKQNTRKLLIDRKYHNGSTDKKECFDLPFCQIFKKGVNENLDSGTVIRLREVKDKAAKFRLGRSAKDGGYSTSTADLDMLSSLASFWATFFATISWNFSVSLRVGILLHISYSGKNICFLFVAYKSAVKFGLLFLEARILVAAYIGTRKAHVSM